MHSFYLLALLLLSLAASATAQPVSRLVGMTKSVNAGGPTPNLIVLDSMRYNYPTATATVYNGEKRYTRSSATGPLNHTSKWDYAYNSAGKLTGVVVQNWNASQSAYGNGSIRTIFLNAAGLPEKDSVSVWVAASSTWRFQSRRTTSYNSAGLVLLDTYESYDPVGGAVVKTYRYTHTYNAQGGRLTYLVQDWSNSLQWMDYAQTTFAYDAGGVNVVQTTNQNRQTLGGPMINSGRSTYTNNAQGKPTTVITHLWNTTTSAFDRLSARLTYTYNAAGNTVTLMQESWNANTSVWQKTDQYEYLYNSFDQMTQATRLYWDGSAFALGVNSDRQNYYYETVTVPNSVATASGEDAGVTVWPTSTSGQVNVRFTGAEPLRYIVVSLSGASTRLMGALEPGTTATLDASALPAGVYIIRATGRAAAVVERFVKQ